MHTLLEIMNPHFVLRNSLYSSVLIGAGVAPIGVFLVLGRRALLALTLPQVSTLGVALFVWLCSFCGVRFVSGAGGGAFFFGAIVSSLSAMAVVLWWQGLLKKRLDVPDDSETAAIYAVATALTLMLAASGRVTELGLLDRLKGEILAVPTPLLVLQALGFLISTSIISALAGPLQFILFDQLLCYTSGLPAELLNAIITVLIAGTITLGGLCAGPLTVFAFLTLPVLIVLPFVDKVYKLYWLGAGVGVLCAFCGFWASYALDDWNIPIPAAQISLLGVLWVLSRSAALFIGRG